MGLGFDVANYYRIDNSAQQEILNYISLMTGYPKENIKIGVDGCGVPVFAAPLKFLANAYLKMACPDLIEDLEIRKVVTKITKVMNENYEMVSGTNRICSLLLMDNNIVAKGGAKGVYCFALREERLGFAIKVMDGAEEQWSFIVASILEQINYKNRETIKRLYDIFPLDTKNDNNKIIGSNKVTFSLIPYEGESV
jgi:L-asparaginase II